MPEQAMMQASCCESGHPSKSTSVLKSMCYTHLDKESTSEWTGVVSPSSVKEEAVTNTCGAFLPYPVLLIHLTKGAASRTLTNKAGCDKKDTGAYIP
jgi:hypothetical protein